MADTLYYVDDYTDEVMPCLPTLDAWAEWLSKPDEAFAHDLAKPGDTFEVSTLIVLGDIRVEWIDGCWEAVTPVPEGTDQFFLRWEHGGQGWDAEHSGDTIKNALDGFDEDEGPFFMACARSGDDLTALFALSDSGPRLLPIQKAS